VVRRIAVLVLTLIVLPLALSACGKDDVEQFRDDARDRVERARREVERARDRIRQRVREVLGDIDRAIPEAPRTDPVVRSQGNTDPNTIDGFMTRVLENIDAYWTRTLQANDLPAPRVRYHWVAPANPARTACGALADDDAAFYCPSDDTIYVAQRFASDLYAGVARDFPGEQAGEGHAGGDFAVAYVLAHEYAHNVQQELDIVAGRRGAPAKPFELQADCMAGTWANSVFEQGLLEPGDLEEAVSTAQAVGDFEFQSQQHHGTPEERRDALLVGYRSGDPSSCQRYVI
jgi:predicted metalloprotease